MKKIFYVLFGIMLLAVSCNDSEDENVICNECSGLFSETLYMWVNNEPTTNPDNPEQKCLNVQFVDYSNYNYVDSLWEPFCDTICGFNYQEGLIYELKVQREKIDKDEDGNPIYKYCLLEVLKTEIAPLKK